MDLLEAVTKVKALTEAVKTGNLVAILDIVGDLAKVAAVLVGGFSASADGSEVDFTEADAAVAELEATVSYGAVGDEVKAIDPATILTIISLVKTVFEFLKKWKS